METDFIAELDKELSNVGTDTVWKRQIGGLLIWISPLTVVGQEKVTAAIGKAELGSNIVGESKRIALANAIVGVGEKDLREFRGGSPVFPTKNREGKVIKTTLDKFLYDKMAQWSAQYIDDVFAVYADLMESFQKENLKGIKFENSKDPHVELQELERKVAELRAQLGLPQMVEGAPEAPAAEPNPEEIAKAIEEEERLNRERAEQGQGPPEDFDPFRPLSPEQQAAAPAPVQAAPVHAAPPQPRQPPPPSPPPQPNMSMPVALPRNLQRPMPPGQHPQESSPEAPHMATPSVPNEVLERPAERPQSRPKIDQVPPNANPRFQPQRR